MEYIQLKFTDQDYTAKIEMIKEKLETLGDLSCRKYGKNGYKASLMFIKIFSNDTLGDCYAYGVSENLAIENLFNMLKKCKCFYRVFIDGLEQYIYDNTKEKFIIKKGV